MTWTLELASNAAASAWTDITTIVDRTSVRMGGQAYNGEAGSSFGFDLADDAASRFLPSRRCVRLTIGSEVVGRGRITIKNVSRGTMPQGDSRAFDVSVGDANMHLQGIPVDGWVRPSETDVARMTALANDFLSGSPRASTDLAQTYLSSADAVTLPAKRYDATNPLGVVGDLIRQTGKFAFITADDEIFYDAPDSTAYAAGLSVTDDGPNLSTEFPPIPESAVQDGTEFLSGAIGKYGTSSSISDLRSTPASDHDYWVEAIYLESAASGDATRELDAIVDDRSEEEDRFVFTVQLTEAQIGLLKYGMTFSYESAAAGILTPRVVRASNIDYEEVGAGIWHLHIEAGFPEKIAPRLGRGEPTGAGGTPLPSCGVTDTFERTEASDFGTATCGLDWAVAASAGTAPYEVDGDAGVINLRGGVASTSLSLRLGGSGLLPLQVPFDAGAVRTLRFQIPDGDNPVAGDNGMSIRWRCVDVSTLGPVIVINGGFSNISFVSTPGTAISAGFWNAASTYVWRVFMLNGSTLRQTVSDGTTTYTADLVEVPDHAQCSLTAILAQISPFTVHDHRVRILDIDIPELTHCSVGGGPLPADSPPGSWVTESIGFGDGSTTAFSTSAAYVPGTLDIRVSALPQPASETTPATGAFELGFAPRSVEFISARYMRA